jgi:hypothetical protein
MKKLLFITLISFLSSVNVNANEKGFKLVCNDSIDTSLPLSITIFNGDTLKFGKIGDTTTDLTVSDVMYSLTYYKEEVELWATIQRNDGRFNAFLKFSSTHTPYKYDGFCKKNEPKF